MVANVWCIHLRTSQRTFFCLFLLSQEMRNTPVHIFLGMPQDNSRTKQLEDLRHSQFDKYRRFSQRWLQRKREKQLQQQPQLQQLNAGVLQPQLHGGTNSQHAQFQQPQPQTQPLGGLQQHTPLQARSGFFASKRGCLYISCFC